MNVIELKFNYFGKYFIRVKKEFHAAYSPLNFSKFISGSVHNNAQQFINTLIHNNGQVSDVQKLHYFKGTLESPAADIISNLSMTNVNYNTGYNLPQNRYNNKFLIITSHLQT